MRVCSATLLMNPPEPRRGHVWWVAFDPSVGREIRKTRPAVVVSNDDANCALNRLQVVPLTSKVAKVYPAQVLVTLEGQQRRWPTKSPLYRDCGCAAESEGSIRSTSPPSTVRSGVRWRSDLTPA
jgi:mRNA-degrading endonuclease toxin of MazEF toxin-antitoxin module